MRKQDIVVHIKDEQMLNEAREILEDAGENIDEIGFYLSQNKDYHFLWFTGIVWRISLIDNEAEITLSQLKELLK